jgi:hypothetical protein
MLSLRKRKTTKKTKRVTKRNIKKGGTIQKSLRTRTITTSSEKNPFKSAKNTKKNITIPYIDTIPEFTDVPGIDPNESLINPRSENFGLDYNGYGYFMFFFKHFLMQPFIRKLFVEKYHPEIVENNRYHFIKIKYKDPNNKYIVKKVKDIINEPGDFIIDLSQQDSHGTGHYTSLKRKDGMIEYMDSDPFFYGLETGQNKELYNLLEKYPNPQSIYGSTNKIEGVVQKSIQNLHQFDTFCQSWSLLFITLHNVANDYTNIYERIHFNSEDTLPHTTYYTEEDVEKDIGRIIDPEDKDATLDAIARRLSNFPNFKSNFLFLIDVWIYLINDNFEELNEIILSEKFTNWNNWDAESIIIRLNKIKRYVKPRIITQYIFKSNVMEIYENDPDDPEYMKNRFVLDMVEDS